MIEYKDLPKVNSERWLSLESLPDEVWKDVPGYEDHFMVSNYSRVYNYKKKKIQKQYENKYGYLIVSTTKNGKSKSIGVHRLVLQAFVANPDNKLYADHIDTNRKNNTLSNLRWATCKENANNPITKINRRNSHLHTLFSDKKIAKYDMNGKLLLIYNSIKEASEDTGIHKCCISNAANKRVIIYKNGNRYQYEAAGGYKWEFV